MNDFYTIVHMKMDLYTLIIFVNTITYKIHNTDQQQAKDMFYHRMKAVDYQNKFTNMNNDFSL